MRGAVAAVAIAVSLMRLSAAAFAEEGTPIACSESDIRPPSTVQGTCYKDQSRYQAEYLCAHQAYRVNSSVEQPAVHFAINEVEGGGDCGVRVPEDVKADVVKAIKEWKPYLRDHARNWSEPFDLKEDGKAILFDSIRKQDGKCVAFYEPGLRILSVSKETYVAAWGKYKYILRGFICKPAGQTMDAAGAVALIDSFTWRGK
ncbi:MAG TPA: hypothetical protein VK433_08350 [Stellaceae bacterium]|nr:hypothetical protein [Stellaceae bacterium]